MNVKQWGSWVLVLIIGLDIGWAGATEAVTKVTTYQLVNSAFIASNERVYFIGNEAFFSDSVNTIVLDSPSGKYKRTLRGVSYPLAVSDGKLYTIKGNYISLVNTKNGELRRLIGISGLNIDRFIDGSTSELSETTRVLTSFQFDGSIVILNIHYSFEYGCSFTVAYNLKSKARLWERNSCSDRTAPYGGIGVFRDYFDSGSGDDLRYYYVKTGENVGLSASRKLAYEAYFSTGENDGLRNTVCQYIDKSPPVVCASENKKTIYNVTKAIGALPFDYLNVSFEVR